MPTLLPCRLDVAALHRTSLRGLSRQRGLPDEVPLRHFSEAPADFDGDPGETFQVFPREFSEGDTIAVYLSNINKDYYDFIQLRLDNRFSLVEFISEPLNYPTNVQGGRGYFNLYVPDIRFLILDWTD